MWYFLTFIFFAVLCIGVPLSFGMGIFSLSYIYLKGDLFFITIPQKIYAGIDSFLLLAIPLFLLAGSLMNRGGITMRLIELARCLVGHIPGALGHVTIVSNTIMAGMSGSAAADAVATGKILIPAMIKDGYSRGFAAAICASAATMAPMIPPSIGLVILGSLGNVSIGQLFLAGIIPGLLMSAYMMGACYLIAKRRGYSSGTRWVGVGTTARAFLRACPALLMPVLVVGSMVGGIVTPTEGAAVAALYALLLGFAQRELRLSELDGILSDVVSMTAVIYLLIGVFNVLTWILAIERIPQLVTQYFIQLTDNVYVLLLVLNVLLLLLGTVMEPVPMMILLGPTLYKVTAAFGIDPVHFSIVFMLNILIGVVSPPIGLNMFIAVTIARCTAIEFSIEVLPFMAALVALLLLITYVPAITLVLPEMLMR